MGQGVNATAEAENIISQTRKGPGRAALIGRYLAPWQAAAWEAAGSRLFC